MLNTKFVFADEIAFKAKINTYGGVVQRTPPNATTLQPETTTPTEPATNETTTTELETMGTTDIVTTTEEETNTTEVPTEINREEATTSTTEYATSTENVTEEVVTEGLQKKETVGEVLFQDVQEPLKKQPQFDYKLKGV